MNPTKKQTAFFTKMGNLTFYNPRSDDLSKSDASSVDKSQKFLRNSVKKNTTDPSHSELPVLNLKSANTVYSRTPTMPEDLTRDMSAIENDNFNSASSIPEDIYNIINKQQRQDTIKVFDVSESPIKKPGKVFSHSLMHKEHLKSQFEKASRDHSLEAQNPVEQVYRSAHEFNNLKMSKNYQLDGIARRKLIEDKTLNLSAHLHGTRGDVSHILSNKHSKSILSPPGNIPEIKGKHRQQFARLLEDIGSESRNTHDTSINADKRQHSMILPIGTSPAGPFATNKLLENNLRESKFFSSPNSARRRNYPSSLNTSPFKETSRTFMSPILKLGTDEDRLSHDRFTYETLHSPDFLQNLASKFESNEGTALHSLKKELPNIFSSVPSNRQEVATLGKWLLSSLKRLHDDKTLLGRDRFHKADELYSLCFNELIRQVSLDCVERGELMMMVWKAYLSLSEEIIDDIKEKEEHAEGKFGEECQKIHSMYDDILKAKESMITGLHQKIEDVEERRRVIQQDAKFIELKEIAKAEEIVKLKENISKLKRHYLQLQQEQRDLQYKYQKLKKNFDLVDDDPLDEQLLIAQQALEKIKKQEESDLDLSSSDDDAGGKRPTNFFGRAQEKIITYADKSILCENPMVGEEVEIQTDLMMLMSEKYDHILEAREVLDNVIFEEEERQKLIQAAQMMENLASEREIGDGNEDGSPRHELEGPDEFEHEPSPELDPTEEQLRVETESVQGDVIQKEVVQHLEQKVEEQKANEPDFEDEDSALKDEDSEQIASINDDKVEGVEQDLEDENEDGNDNSNPESHRSDHQNDEENLELEGHEVKSPDTVNKAEAKVMVKDKLKVESSEKEDHKAKSTKDSPQKSKDATKAASSSKRETVQKVSKSPDSKANEKEKKPVEQSKTVKEAAVAKKPEKEAPKRVVEPVKQKPIKEVPVKKPEKVVEKKVEEKPKIVIKDKPVKDQAKDKPIKEPTKSLNIPISDVKNMDALQRLEEPAKLKSSIRSSGAIKGENAPSTSENIRKSVKIDAPETLTPITGQANEIFIEDHGLREEQNLPQNNEPEAANNKDAGDDQEQRVQDDSKPEEAAEQQVDDDDIANDDNIILQASDPATPSPGSQEDVEDGSKDELIDANNEEVEPDMAGISMVDKIDTKLNLMSQQALEDLRYEIKQEEISHASITHPADEDNTLKIQDEPSVEHDIKSINKKRRTKKSMTTAVHASKGSQNDDISLLSSEKINIDATKDKALKVDANKAQKSQRNEAVGNSTDRKRAEEFAEKQEQRIIQLMNMYKVEKKKQDEVVQVNKELEKKASEDLNKIKNLQNYIEELKKRLDITEQNKDKLNIALRDMEEKQRSNPTMDSPTMNDSKPRLFSKNSIEFSKTSIRFIDRPLKKKTIEDFNTFDVASPTNGAQFKLPAMLNSIKQARKHFLQEKKSNVGLTAIAKVQAKSSKTKDIVPLKSVLKQITSFYIDKMQMSKDNPLIKEQDMGTFVYKQFLNTYGFQQFAQKKFTKFIISVKKHAIVSRVNKFARMLGLLEASLNYNTDETKQYFTALEFLLTNTTFGVHYPNPDYEKKHFAPFNRAVEYLRMFSERKMKPEETADLRRELEKFKSVDPTGRNTSGLIDIDEFLERLIASYRTLINREKDMIKSVFTAGDPNSTNHLAYLDFVILCRNIEADRYDERRVEEVYTNSCDMVADDDIVLSFDRFATICYDMNIFSEQRQMAFLGIHSEQDVGRKYEELKGKWKEEKTNLAENINKNHSAAPHEVFKVWQDSLAWIDGQITGGKSVDLKAVLMKHRILWNDVVNGANRAS